MLLAAMRRSGNYRRYPLLFFLCVLLFLSAVVETAALSPMGFSRYSMQYRAYYWANESVIQLLTFLLMMSLIYRALEGVGGRLALSLGLTITVAVILLGSLVWSGVTLANYRWMTPLSRNLSFSSALLNLVLWSALLRRRGLSGQLLMISAGLGLVTTGKAVGHSLRLISGKAVDFGNLVIVGTFLLSLLLWWYAFARLGSTPKPRRRTLQELQDAINANPALAPSESVESDRLSLT
jgi:hypothetical protein